MITLVSSFTFRHLLPRAIEIYQAAMGLPDVDVDAIGRLWRMKTLTSGFLAAVAYEPLAENPFIGFCFGVPAPTGSRWDQIIRAAATGPNAHLCTNYFQLSELHVFPEYQRRGCGRQLLAELLSHLPNKNVVLTTPEAVADNSPALRLYLSFGMVDLARQVVFPDDPTRYAVLGLNTGTGHTTTASTFLSPENIATTGKITASSPQS